MPDPDPEVEAEEAEEAEPLFELELILPMDVFICSVYSQKQTRSK